uniref:outer membrane beta-barrel protein n=1 Tax=Pedobacter schmidteae TaxID=2201271 RepID=UPI000EB51FA1|nr:outer membrane beta-barrel protein [Pedobacter schmidteae]
MKKHLLTAVAVMAALCGYAQTKGTSALGFGITSQNYKYETTNGSTVTKSENKYNSYSLSYGYFIQDNAKLGIELNYGDRNDDFVANVSGSKTKQYGASVNYQHYYPLIKKLYAYAGGAIGYGYSKSETGNNNSNDNRTDFYSAGVQGGLTWFVSKRFALETSLLSANATYAKSENTGTMGGNIGYKNTSSNFNLSSTGAISNLGFKVYILF